MLIVSFGEFAVKCFSHFYGIVNSFNLLF